MMTHIFEDKSGKRSSAAKGAAQTLMVTSQLFETEKMKIEKAIRAHTDECYRVLGVAEAIFFG